MPEYLGTNIIPLVNDNYKVIDVTIVLVWLFAKMAVYKKWFEIFINLVHKVVDE